MAGGPGRHRRCRQPGRDRPAPTLRWHHFYDRGSQAAGLIADGIFHYDGIIQHKLLGLHQVRAAAPNNLPYDLVFIGLATVVLVAGLLLLRLGRSAESRAT